MKQKYPFIIIYGGSWAHILSDCLAYFLVVTTLDFMDEACMILSHIFLLSDPCFKQSFLLRTTDTYVGD